MPTNQCVFCEGQSRHLFDRFGIPILGCTECELRFADFTTAPDHTQKFYADDYFDCGQDGYADYLANRESIIERGNQYALLMRRHAPSKGRVLDVGSAAGLLLKAFVDDGWVGEGVEPNSKMAAYGREELGVTVNVGTLVGGDWAADSMDLVTLIQVISHFPSLVPALEKVANITKVGGHCLVETWDYKSLSARMVGQAWHQYSPPRVLYWFTRDLLNQMFERFGFQCVATGRASKWVTGKHAKTLASHSRNGSLGGGFVHAMARLIPDSASIPYPGNDCFWAIYKKRPETN